MVRKENILLQETHNLGLNERKTKKKMSEDIGTCKKYQQRNDRAKITNPV